MRKPNWKARGLPRPLSAKDLNKKREAELLEQRIRKLPKEMQHMVRTSLVYGDRDIVKYLLK